MTEYSSWAHGLGNSGQLKLLQQCTNDEKQLCYLPWNHFYYLMLLTPLYFNLCLEKIHSTFKKVRQVCH